MSRKPTALARGRNANQWIKPYFKKPFLALSFNRDFSIVANDTFSIGTLDGRIKVPFSRKGFEKYFDDKCTFGGANLIKKKDKFYSTYSAKKMKKGRRSSDRHTTG